MSKFNGRDIFLIVVAIFQVGFAGFAFVYLVSVLIAGAAYLAIGPLALPALLYVLWGVVSGVRLLFRRTIAACRAAATWYLPIGLFLLAYGMHTSAHSPTGHAEYVFLGAALLSIFTVLVVPLLPGYYPSSRLSEGMRN